MNWWMRDDMKIEMEAGRNIQLDHIKEMLAKNDMVRQNEEMVKIITKLREQNKKLIKTLKKYANDKNWRFDSITGFHTVYQGGEFDDEVHEGFRDARITLIEMGEKK